VRLAQVRPDPALYVKVWEVDGAASAGMPLIRDDLLTRLVLQSVVVGRRFDLPGAALPFRPDDAGVALPRA
jgi:hypothetical protein